MAGGAANEYKAILRSESEARARLNEALVSADASAKAKWNEKNYGGIDIGCTGTSKDIKLEAYNGNVRILRPIIDYPVFNTYEDTDYSVWVPYTQFNAINGVWTNYRDTIYGDFCWKKEGKELKLIQQSRELIADFMSCHHDHTHFNITSLEGF